MNSPNPKDPRRRGWTSAVRAWAIVALILGGTYALVVVVELAPHEWAAAVTFVVAHLVAAEVVVANHKPRH